MTQGGGVARRHRTFANQTRSLKGIGIRSRQFKTFFGRQISLCTSEICLKNVQCRQNRCPRGVRTRSRCNSHEHQPTADYYRYTSMSYKRMRDVVQKQMLGYTRVSTQRQAEEGSSLQAQLDLLRGYAAAKDIDLPELYEDVASASGSRSLSRRMDLQAAIRRALQLGVPILVARLDRLSRDASVLKQLDVPGLHIHSVADGGRVSKKKLREAIRRAQRQAEELSRRACKVHERNRGKSARAKQQQLSKSAQRDGAISNMLRADGKVQELADFLEVNPVWLSRPRQTLVNHLNEVGSWNLVSLRDQVRKPWTVAALRKPLAKALDELEFRSEVLTDDFAAFPGSGDIQHVSGPAPAHVAIPEETLPDARDEIVGANNSSDEENFYADNPLFGAF